MRWIPIICILLMMIGQCDAIQLEYNRFFPECTFNDPELTITSMVRCSCYIFIPNLHLEAGYDLVIKSFGDGMLMLMKDEIEYFIEFAKNFFPDNLARVFEGNNGFIDGSTQFISEQFTLVTAMILQPLVFILDIIAGVIAYMILLMFEFVKTYLFWFVVPVGSVNLMLRMLATVGNLKHDTNIGMFIFNPIVMSVILTVVVVLGSIILIFADIGIFNLRFF